MACPRTLTNSDRPGRRDAALFLLFFVIVFASKWNTLHIPYYWDETGWATAAYWLSGVNLVRAIPGLHPPTTFWGHPPALYVSLATLLKLFGHSVWPSRVLIFCFALLGTYFTYLLGRLLYGRTAGMFSAGFLFFSETYFAQSGMFLGDLPVTAFGVMAIYFALRQRYAPYLLCGSYCVLIKETAGAIVCSLVIYVFLTTRGDLQSRLREVAKYSVPLLVLIAFFVWQKFATGHFCCIYPFNFELFEARKELLVHKAVVISEWLFWYQYRYIFTGMIALNVLLNKAARRQKEFVLFVSIFVLSGYSFCFLYFLPRYLLPTLPYLCIAAAGSIVSVVRFRIAQMALAGGTLALLVYSLPGTILRGNYEWNMTYLDVVQMHKAIYTYIADDCPMARVLTVWPHTVQLRQPHLGYVKMPIAVVPFAEDTDSNAFDVLLLSIPSADEKGALREYARRNNLHLVKRLAQGRIIAELYTMSGANRCRGL